MSAVVKATIGVVVVPTLVVDRNPHFGRVAVVQAVGTPVVFVTPEILRVVHVRIVVEALPILGRVGLAPRAAVGLLGRRGVGIGNAAGESPGAANGK